MRVHFLVVLLFFSVPTNAEEYTCTYMGFLSKEPVILKIRIEGKKAYDEQSEYAVLQNTQAGIVLAHSFAYMNNITKQNEIGLFGIVIDRPTLKMTRGNIIRGDSNNAIQHGRCIK